MAPADSPCFGTQLIISLFKAWARIRIIGALEVLKRRVNSGILRSQAVEELRDGHGIQLR
jgi:hypothetical protein